MPSDEVTFLVNKCGFDSEFEHDPSDMSKKQRFISLQFSFGGERHVVRSRGQFEDLMFRLPTNWFSYNLSVELGALEMLGFVRHRPKALREARESDAYKSANRRGKRAIRIAHTGEFSVYSKGSQLNSTFRPRGTEFKFKLFDLMGLCKQLGMFKLADVGEFLVKSGVLGYAKLPDPAGCSGCSLYPCDKSLARWKCDRYALHDAVIVDKFITFMEHEFDCDFTKFASMGGLAASFLDLPKRNRYAVHVTRSMRNVRKVEVDPLERVVQQSLYAGRNECFMNGYVGKVFYNDVMSLYPSSMLIAGIFNITGVEECSLGELEITRDLTNRSYGWVTGSFLVDRDKWGLPFRHNNRNYYLNDSCVRGTYHTMDLAAAGAKVESVTQCLKPVFSEDNRMREKYTELYWKKNRKQYRNGAERLMYKGILNSTSGKLGQGASNRTFLSRTTNFPAYSTLLACSHLVMSNIMRETPGSVEIAGMDTDSLVATENLEGEYWNIDGIPVALATEHSGRMAYMRSKLYAWLDLPERPRTHAWHYAPGDFSHMVGAAYYDGLLDRFKAHQSVRVTPNVRDARLGGIPIGMWFHLDHVLDKGNQVRLCIADVKQQRKNYNSLELLADKSYDKGWAHTIYTLPNEIPLHKILELSGYRFVPKGAPVMKFERRFVETPQVRELSFVLAGAESSPSLRLGRGLGSETKP